jgi:hypothetical protein
MFNRICFGGSYYIKYWFEYLPDINLREFFILLALVLFTIILGIYPSIILDSLNYYVSSLIFNVSYDGELNNQLVYHTLTWPSGRNDPSVINVVHTAHEHHGNLIISGNWRIWNISPGNVQIWQASPYVPGATYFWPE